MSPASESLEQEREIQRVRASLADLARDHAVATAKLEMLTRLVEDLRLQNYRLEAQYTESRIGRAVAEERATAAREAAARAFACCCPCCGHPAAASSTPYGGTPGAGGPGSSTPGGGTPGGSVPGGGVPGGGAPNGGGGEPPRQKLVIDRMVVQQTPQSGTWLMCFIAKAQGGAQNLFHVPNQTYEGDGIVIDMGLVLSPVAEGEQIGFKCQLDDDEADVCGNGAEDKSAGEFRASRDGSAAFSFDNWVYTLNWHMETA